MILYSNRLGPLAFYAAGPSWELRFREELIARGVFVSPLAWLRSKLWRAGLLPNWAHWIKPPKEARFSREEG